MGTEFTDKGGEPREDREILEAKKVLREALCAPFKKGDDPSLILCFPTVLEALNELLMLRQFLRKIKEGN